MSAVVRFDLDVVPDGARSSGVVAKPVSVGGRRAVQVRLSDDIELHGRPGVDYVDRSTFLVLPVSLARGTISVDVHSRIRPGAPEMARGFAGLAFHIRSGRDAFESVYLRPLNGADENPPVERRDRAVQYFAYPDHPFDRLRDERPGEYEAAARIGLDRWCPKRPAS